MFWYFRFKKGTECVDQRITSFGYGTCSNNYFFITQKPFIEEIVCTMKMNWIHKQADLIKQKYRMRWHQSLMQPRKKKLLVETKRMIDVVNVKGVAKIIQFAFVLCLKWIWRKFNADLQLLNDFPLFWSVFSVEDVVQAVV